MIDCDALIAHASAQCFHNFPCFQEILVGLSQSNFTKALLFAPFLLVAWYGSGNDRLLRAKVIATPFSCALGLFFVWCFTSTWMRLRPLDPHSGHALVSQVFLPFFGEQSRLLKWGCFPSDHAAYLTALSLALYTLNKKVGASSFCIAVLLNGMLRMAVGLHYISDIVVGVLFGVLAHVLIFGLIAFPRRNLAAHLVHSIEQSILMQIVLIVGVIEMAILFQDIRALDTLLFRR